MPIQGSKGEPNEDIQKDSRKNNYKQKPILFDTWFWEFILELFPRYPEADLVGPCMGQSLYRANFSLQLMKSFGSLLGRTGFYGVIECCMSIALPAVITPYQSMVW